MRFIFILFISIVSLIARDNPFFPADPNEIQATTSNRVEILKPFSTQELTLPNSARAIKGICVTYQNLDGSVSHEELVLNNKIDWHEPLIISQKKAATKSVKQKSKSSKSIKTKYISFYPQAKRMKVVTKDKLLHNFMLTSPHRVVLDFSRDTSFKPKYFAIKKPPFKKIRMGNHDKYYRVVIELDGQYHYKLEMDNKDLSVVCY